MANREEFLALRPPVEVVEIPERGLKFSVRGLTAGEREEYEMGLVTIDRKTGQVRPRPDQKNLRTSLVVRTLIGDDGERMFADDEVGKLRDIDAFVVEAVYKAARRLSGMRDLDEEVPTSAQDDGDASA